MKPWKKTQKAWTWNEDRVPKGKLKREIESITRAKLKEDLRNEIEEYEAGDEFRYQHYSHKKNEIESLKSKIQHYEQMHETYKNLPHNTSWRSYWQERAREMRKKLRKLEDGERETRSQQTNE